MITLYLGSMKSSKTSKLYEVLDKCSYRKNIKYCLVRPSIDTRKFVTRLKDTTGHTPFKVIKCGDNLNEILNELLLYDVICIDEGQFIKDLGEICNKLSLRKKEIYIAALNGDAELKPWDSISNCIPFADRIVRLSGICEECGKRKTTFSFYDGCKNSQIKIGDNKYKIYCRQCWFKKKNG